MGFVKIRNTKGKAFNPTRGSIFSSHEGPGGHISPRSHSASKRIKSTTFLGTICTEWATNQFSWSYCRYLQTAGPKMQEKLSVEIISDKIQKSVLAIMIKILILGQI